MKERDHVILESIKEKQKKNLWHKRLVIEALGKRTSTSSQRYKYNPKPRGNKKEYVGFFFIVKLWKIKLCTTTITCRSQYDPTWSPLMSLHFEMTHNKNERKDINQHESDRRQKFRMSWGVLNDETTERALKTHTVWSKKMKGRISWLLREDSVKW